MPPSFEVPLTVDGETTACGVPDQRGVEAVAGVNCDIGAFRLLKPTTTAVTATYSGAAGFSGSRSTPETVVVSPAPPAAAPSTAAPAAPPATPDRKPPTSRMQAISSSTQPITLRGTAADANGIRRVRVSVARHVGKLCRFLRADRTFSTARSCKKTPYIDAKGTSLWSLKLPKLLPGRYTIWTRSIDTAGNVERKGRVQNLRVVLDPVGEGLVPTRSER